MSKKTSTPAVKSGKSSPAPVAAKPAAPTPVAPKATPPKADAAKPEAPAKEVKPAKPEVPAFKFVARSVQPGKPIYALADGARPTAGKALYAHTFAALTALGVLDDKRPVVPHSAMLTLLGQRAVNYHVSKGNLEKDGNGGMRLTDDGLDTFNLRTAGSRVDPKMADGYLCMILDGNAKAAGVNQGDIYPAKFS